MKLAILNDLHWGKFSDAEFMLDIQERFYKETFIPYVLKNGITHILILGDLFDKRRVINVHTLFRAKQMFFDVLSQYDISIHIIPGNHDCSYKNTNKINSLTTTLREYKNVKIYENPTVVNLGMDIAFIPWINGENQEEVLKFVENTSCKILCGHLELSGFDMYRGIPQKHGMDSSVFRKFDMVLTGHYHLKSSKDNIHYLGSQFQFTWADYNERKYFHVLDTDTSSLLPIENPVSIYTRIEYNGNPPEQNIETSNKIVELFVIDRGDPKKFDTFIQSIEETTPIELKIKEVCDKISVENDSIDDDTKTTKQLIEEHISSISEDILDKDRLLHLFEVIYTEATQDKI